jgi:hypothetical protein
MYFWKQVIIYAELNLMILFQFLFSVCKIEFKQI